MLINSVAKENSWVLADLIKDLKVKEKINFKNYKINNITNNSKEVTEGSIFVAIEGFNVDGHDYIFEARENGAVAIIGEKNMTPPADMLYIRVSNSRKALAKLAAKFYNYPYQQMRLIGVTGTAGKTTTASMVDSIINQVVKQTGLIGTLHTKIGDKCYSNPHQCTTPDAVTLYERLARMKREKIDYASMEVSSHALKLDRVYGLEFNIGIFTNLSYDHLDFHPTLDDYYQSKAKLFSNLKSEGVAIFNLDDDYTKSLISDLVSNNYYTYGIEKEADVVAQKIKLTRQGITFDIEINQELVTLNKKIIKPQIIKIKLPILGYHNIYNALAAFIAGVVLGISLEDIKKGLEGFTGVKRRMELIYDEEFTIIDDFAHNPASLTANFETIKELEYNNLVIIHFLKGQRGTKINRLNAQLIADWSKELDLKEIITTKCAKRVTEKNKVLFKEEEVFTDIISEHNIRIINMKELEDALKLGLDKVTSNDLLLLLGGPGLNKASEIIDSCL
ncbi:UDP-N-acetylmuramyl-tripeptide synthetase [Halobacteroides halobius DSM 5150]|uniref:UDP-N-acetylmuramyl-tripeptide synthetase n=1 Tax=Halobacteroides halobius (strain ATCC 35273 / DSM 5150 / MD-1) TaxID=748449 RepID=L0K789_HALHC|nr:UDP-N-acetylmuramoyl-L-alanyl-D-glutamate--2,6-diaminopimelate ligase [Halobacteroides halobius]AGB40400.1 UDP-N-acetylmuramyl-tripeptide synthetase [Halobacteroides halobius DSM 5150]